MCLNGNIFSVGICNTLLEIPLPIVNITISVFDTIRAESKCLLEKCLEERGSVCQPLLPWEGKRVCPLAIKLVPL